MVVSLFCADIGLYALAHWSSMTHIDRRGYEANALAGTRA